MVVRDVKVIEVAGRRDPDGRRSVERLVRPLDVYAEFRDEPSRPTPPDAGPVPVRHIYVDVLTDDALGRYGPIMREQAFLIRTRLRPFLIGRDPRPVAKLWDQMVRLDRHARAGHFMMAISAVDCALWDLRGRSLGEPVYRLLGGPTRDELPAYASMLGHSLDTEKLSREAVRVRDEGLPAQKWFFRYGPGSGAAGRRANIEMARSLRSALGEDAEIMFDAWMSWDVRYAVEMARGLEPVRPGWLEEPLPPGDLEGFARLKRETACPLAGGEHLYTRREVLPFLQAGVLDVVQADPDWTGGITELARICAMAEPYGVRVVPHGHNVAAALHVVAAQPPSLCPMVEFLLLHAGRQQFFHAMPLRPRDGAIALPETPGLGLELDESRIEGRRELTFE
ncbi:MAG: enolase C-terminal domain-like protein [Planctomycetota bacterium]|jgi:L-alanine-DL-glutamate epimerase-like enolase superfamily enzyme